MMEQPEEYSPQSEDVRDAIAGAERLFEALSRARTPDRALADALAPLRTPGPHDQQVVEAALREYAAVAEKVGQRIHDELREWFEPSLEAFPVLTLSDLDRILGGPRGGPCRLFIPRRRGT